MKRIFLTLSFVAFLSAGLVSCADEAAEVTPSNIELNQLSTGEDPAARTKP